MRQGLLAFSLAAFSFALWPAAPAAAQNTKNATGTVTEAGAASVTIMVDGQSMKFAVDAKTVVVAPGAGTAERKSTQPGNAALKLTDVVKVGRKVEVSYTGMGTDLRASRIRTISSAGSGGSEPAEMTTNGTVSAVGADSITVTASVSGGGSSTQTFVIDASTTVVGEGVGTAAAAKGGKVSFKEVIRNGDKVSVSYHAMGEKLHAASVRISAKGKG